MKRHGLALLCWLAISLAGCANRVEFPHLAEHGSGAERRILVTFVDRSIGRELSANPMDLYQSRGGYSNSDWSARRAEALASRYRLSLIAQWPVTALGVACIVYEVPGDQSLERVLAALARDGQVESAQPMGTFRVLGQPSSDSGSDVSDPYLRLQTGYRNMKIAAAHRFATGKGVRIAVIDTGVDARHPDLAGQVSVSENLAPDPPPGGDTADVHGTAVAGVLAAHVGNGIGIAGVAPDARIHALRACWPEKPGVSAALCNSFTLALALNEAIRLETQVINMSLTGPEDPLVRKLIEKALEKGLIVIAAEPGAGRAGGFPANVPGVIAVRGADGALGQLAAPGTDVLTTVPRGAYEFMSGSSFAAPHVAGAIALLLELKPRLTSAEALRILTENLSSTEPRFIDACAALATLKGVNSGFECG